MAAVDTLVVGQGLAGTTLAWSLLLRGARPLVLDAGKRPAASRLAAGLLAPVGGKRFGLAWRAAEAWPAALAFYRRVEQRLGVRLLGVDPIWRLFVDEEHRREFERRSDGPLRGWVDEHGAGELPACFNAPLGGCRVVGARLDVPAYLDGSRQYFAEQGLLIQQDLDLPAATDDDVGRAVEGVASNRPPVVLCRGLGERETGVLPFEPAKGELLTVRAAGVGQQRVVQRGVWMAPLGDERFLVGATFAPNEPAPTTTEAGHAELLWKLDDMLRTPCEVIAHDAGVRPIVRSRRPLAGLLPGQQRVGVFNGLGASGTLWAPWVAGDYAAHLLENAPLDAEYDARLRLAGG